MKKFIVNVVDVRNFEFNISAKSKHEAFKKVKDIIENTDLVDTAEAEASTYFKIFDSDNADDDMCDGDCDDCLYDDEEECLLDELY